MKQKPAAASSDAALNLLPSITQINALRMNRASLRNSKAAISASNITVSPLLLDFLQNPKLTTSQISHEAVHSSPRPFYNTESADFNTTHVGKQHRTHPTITPLSASARNAQNPAVLTQSARPILPCPAAASQRAPHRIGNQAEGHSCTHLRQSPPSPFRIAIYTSSHRLNQARLYCAT